MPTNTLFMTGLLCVWYAISATANPRYRNQWGRSVISSRDLAPARCRFRSTRFLPPPTGRLVDPPHRLMVPGCRRSKPKEWGRSETGLQESIPVRSRHSRAAASAPASLRFFTILNGMPQSRALLARRIEALGASSYLRDGTLGPAPPSGFLDA